MIPGPFPFPLASSLSLPPSPFLPLPSPPLPSHLLPFHLLPSHLLFLCTSLTPSLVFLPFLSLPRPLPHPQTEELLKKMSHLPECKLTWEGAVRALTLNNMDVDTACWVIQCDTLQPLYESIFSEFQQVKQKDMEEIKELIKNKDFDQDVRRGHKVYLGCTMGQPLCVEGPN